MTPPTEDGTGDAVPVLSDGARRMLRILVEHGGAMSKDELIRRTIEDKAREAAETN